MTTKSIIKLKHEGSLVEDPFEIEKIVFPSLKAFLINNCVDNVEIRNGLHSFLVWISNECNVY